MDGTETVLDDQEEAQYTHNLTVTGSIDGSYTCFVANNKPSFAMKSYLIDGKTVPYIYNYINMQPHYRPAQPYHYQCWYSVKHFHLPLLECSQ